MAPLKTTLLGLGSLILFVVSLFLGVSLFKPKLSGVNLNTTPSSTVIINGQEVGKTPFRDFYKPGKYIVRLVPEGSGELLPLDQEVYLEKGMELIVRHNFDAIQERSFGYSIFFEKASSNVSAMNIITNPVGADIVIDGTPRSKAPYYTPSLTPGSHQVEIKKEGFEQVTLDVNLVNGYQLNLRTNLSVSDSQAKPQVTPNPTPTLVDRGLGFVEVSDTPTGFLRIRSEASSLGSEVGKAIPGEKYVLIDIDPKTGWFKIEYRLESSEDSIKEGWISNQYAKRTTEGSTQSQKTED